MPIIVTVEEKGWSVPLLKNVSAPVNPLTTICMFCAKPAVMGLEPNVRIAV